MPCSTTPYNDKITPKEYINNLYTYLASLNKCFISGAFVIEDKMLPYITSFDSAVEMLVIFQH